MGTNTKPKPDQLGAARPSQRSQEIDQLPPEELWEWTGGLLDVEQHADVSAVRSLEVGLHLGPRISGGHVLVALRNRVLGRLPEEPGAAVSTALAGHRLMSIDVVAVEPNDLSITVRVRVAI
jgi:hypothetical protein